MALDPYGFKPFTLDTAGKRGLSRQPVAGYQAQKAKVPETMVVMDSALVSW